MSETVSSSSSIYCFLEYSSLNSLLLVVFRRKFSDSIAEMLVVCATTVHRVALQTAPNELCPRVPLMAWNTCAFTIQAIGTVRVIRLIMSICPFSCFCSPHNMFACLLRKHFAGRGQATLRVLTEQTGWMPHD